MLIENPRDWRFQAIMLKAHLKLMAAGMKHSKLTQGQLLRKASALTGNRYPPKGGARLAINDLQTMLDGEWMKEGEVK